MLSILQVAAEVNIWADKARPRFVEIVGPYKKWGGDNADAFYCYAPIDPARTYRVRLDPGDAVYMSLTVYGGPDDGRYSTRIVGIRQQPGAHRATPTAPSTSSSRRPIRPSPASAWIRLEPDAVAAITRDYLDDPVTGRRAAWHIEADDPPETYRQDDADLARRIRAATTWVREQASIVPIPLGTPNAIDPPVPGARPRPSAGRPATPPTPWAPSSWPTTRRSSSAAARPSASSGTCACGTALLHTYNYDYERVTINGAQVQYEPDGSWIIVVSARRPAHPNWVSTAGHRTGRIWFRWFLPAETPEQPQVEVLPVDTGMSARPAPVRIDDLAEPRFSDEVRAILDFMEEAGSQLTLEPAALMAPAARRDRTWTTSAPTTSSSGSTCCAGPCARRAASTGPASCSSTSFILGPAEEPAAHRGPGAAPPRDPRRADHRARSSSAGCPARAPRTCTT